MKSITLIRHGKAQQHDYETDFTRTLTEKGIVSTKKIATQLKKEQTVFDLMITSNAARALETATIFATELDYPIDKIIHRDELYFEMTTSSFFDMIEELPNEVQSVCIVGHNPLIHSFINGLINDYIMDVPTSFLATVTFDIESWKSIEPQSGKVVKKYIPSMFS